MVAIRNAGYPGGGLSGARAMRGRGVDADAVKPEARTTGEQLLCEIRAFLRAHRGFTTNGFGIQAANNPQLIARLEQGANPQPVTCARVRRFIADYRAEDRA